MVIDAKRVSINKDDIVNRLDSCLLTDEEFNRNPESWQRFYDPIDAWEFVEEEDPAFVE